MKQIKLRSVVLLIAATLIFTACNMADVQDDLTQAADAHVQVSASQESTLAAEDGQDIGDQPTAVNSAQLAITQSTTQKSSQPSTAGGISLEKAKEIALCHAGLNGSQITFAKAVKENDNGIAKYMIEFEKDSWEYEYEIHAGTGVILDSERKRKSEETPDQQAATQSSLPNDSDEIGLEKAKEIALADAGFSAEQVTFKRAKREKEHGIAIYEIKFKKDGREYEYEIHAGTGVVLKSKGKSAAETTQPSQANGAGEIGLEKAKGIALTDAGFTAEQVRFKKAKQKRDDGVTKYEIEFVKDGREYKYEINADTGAILKRHSD